MLRMPCPMQQRCLITPAGAPAGGTLSCFVGFVIRWCPPHAQNALSHMHDSAVSLSAFNVDADVPSGSAKTENGQY